MLCARGDDVTLWAPFASPETFVSALSALRPSQSKTDISSLFIMRDQGQPEDPKTGKPVCPETIDSCKLLWKDDTSALVFATASPRTEATRSVVGVLFLLRRLHDRCHLWDYRRFTASGKYAGVTAAITGMAGTGSGVRELPIVTITESQGGRGHSFQLSATYTVDGARLGQMELD